MPKDPKFYTEEWQKQKAIEIAEQTGIPYEEVRDAIRVILRALELEEARKMLKSRGKKASRQKETVH